MITVFLSLHHKAKWKIGSCYSLPVTPCCWNLPAHLSHDLLICKINEDFKMLILSYVSASPDETMDKSFLFELFPPLAFLSFFLSFPPSHKFWCTQGCFPHLFILTYSGFSLPISVAPWGTNMLLTQICNFSLGFSPIPPYPQSRVLPEHSN